jgi:hypothetical protein
VQQDQWGTVTAFQYGGRDASQLQLPLGDGDPGQQPLASVVASRTPVVLLHAVLWVRCWLVGAGPGHGLLLVCERINPGMETSGVRPFLSFGRGSGRVCLC